MKKQTTKFNKSKLVAKRTLILILILSFSISMLSGCLLDGIIDQIPIFTTKREDSGEGQKIVWEKKVYCHATIEDDFAPGQVLVLLDKAISAPNKVHPKEFFVGVEIEEIYDLSRRDTPLSPGEVFRQSLLLVLVDKTKEAVIDAYKKLEQIDGIKAANPNHRIIFENYPDDPYCSFTGLADDQWAIDTIDAPLIWNFTTGNSSIRVGVIDSGIANHTDLNGNYDYYDALNFNDINSNIQSFGKSDSNSHGTHVAGIIGAVGNNAQGISGVNWDVSLVQMRLLDTGNYIDSIINAIKYASSLWNTDKRINILNLSIGVDSHNPQLEDAIRSFCDQGGLFICSTGNRSQNNDEIHHYPSFYASRLYEDPIVNMISVGRTDKYDYLPYDANWGQSTINIYAPGEDILSTFPENICVNNSFIVSTEWGDRYACECKYEKYNGVDQWVPYSNHFENGYHYMSGSSMSAPHVSGVAALLLSVNPNLSSAQLESCIMNGADIITILTGERDTQTVKRLNAWGAFKYLMKNYPIYQQDIGYRDLTSSYNIDSDASFMNQNTSMMKFNVEVTGEYVFNITSNDPIEVKLYDNNLQEISATQTNQNENKEIEFTLTLSKNTYYLRTNYMGVDSEGTIFVHIDSPPHTHEYTAWAPYTTTKHIECCALCGQLGTVTGTHVVEVGSEVNNRARCIYCGDTLLILDNAFPGIMSITKYSANGSYILSNGIIVLVDEDIEAYLNGTLVFYNKDELTVEQ